MMSRRKQVNEDMKSAIRQAAAQLFAEKGYLHVTMREIARLAGCSHTAIYLYFKSKEELLQQIAIPSLLELENEFLAELAQRDKSPSERLIAVCSRFVSFCLSNGSLHTVLFLSSSVRVDDPAPALELNVIRNRLFAHMAEALQLVVSPDYSSGSADETAGQEAALNRARVLFYYVHGFVSTYTGHSEPADSLMARILPIFKEGILILLQGMQRQ